MSSSRRKYSRPPSRSREASLSDFRMLETQTLYRVVEFNVHTQVVGIQLERVTGLQSRVLIHHELQKTHSITYFELPVTVS